MQREQIERSVRELVEPILDGAGFELVDVMLVSEHGAWVLRVFMDRPGGVTIGELTGMSREVSTHLDVAEVIPERYSLEVSSPGIDRPLVSEKDFERVVGRKLRVRTRNPVNGKRSFKATLQELKPPNLVMTDEEGENFEIGLEDIEKARLEVEI